MHIFISIFVTTASTSTPPHAYTYTCTCFLSCNWQEALGCPLPLLEKHETKTSTFLPPPSQFCLDDLSPTLACCSVFLFSLNATYFKHVLTSLQLEDNRWLPLVSLSHFLLFQCLFMTYIQTARPFYFFKSKTKKKFLRKCKISFKENAKFVFNFGYHQKGNPQTRKRKAK